MLRVCGSLLVILGCIGAAPAEAPADYSTESRVVRRQIGVSVDGRALWAYRLGDPAAGTTAVLLASMHGDERDGRVTLRAVAQGPPVNGVDLWVVPTVNPDGWAARTRLNGAGVDLNRNFPHRWAELDGEVESGPGPRSEPETRALIRFLNRVNPRTVVSLHQPLFGVDTYQVKRWRLARRLSAGLELPLRRFACTGVCQGTLTGWFNARHRGAAITVEYGATPRRTYLVDKARRVLVRATGGSYR